MQNLGQGNREIAQRVSSASQLAAIANERATKNAFLEIPRFFCGFFGSKLFNTMKCVFILSSLLLASVSAIAPIQQSAQCGQFFGPTCSKSQSCIDNQCKGKHTQVVASLFIGLLSDLPTSKWAAEYNQKKRCVVNQNFFSVVLRFAIVPAMWAVAVDVIFFARLILLFSPLSGIALVLDCFLVCFLGRCHVTSCFLLFFFSFFFFSSVLHTHGSCFALSRLCGVCGTQLLRGKSFSLCRNSKSLKVQISELHTGASAQQQLMPCCLTLVAALLFFSLRR